MKLNSFCGTFKNGQLCNGCFQPDEVASLVDERQNALRKLKVNPHNKEALGTVFKVQQQVPLHVSIFFSRNSKYSPQGLF